ncbi:MAG: hypothetical protein Q9213_007632 [Squamulea squamosa]
MPAVLPSEAYGGHEPEEHLGELVLVDDLFKARARDKVQKPLLAFPKSEQGVSDFEYFTGYDLDRFVEHAAKHYIKLGLQVNQHARLAVLGPTNIEWFATFFGLLRAGFAVVTLSPRISAQAIINLMSETQCKTIVYTDSLQLRQRIDQVKDETSYQIVPMLCRTGFDKLSNDEPPLVRIVDKVREADRMAIIMHSSGSTGLPKPIYTNHTRYVHSDNLVSPGSRDFMTLPMYHNFPMSVVPWKMYSRRTVYFPNANLPITRQNVTEAVKAAQPDAIYAVPHILKLLAEQPQSIEVMSRCHEVMTLGSQCPDELGNRLVDQGVNLCNLLGATEVGLIGSSSNRAVGDKDWAYIRVSPSKLKHIWPRPVEDNQYEFVFLESYPVDFESNSDDPPNSFRSKDVFSPHPSIPDAWKYSGRLDDRVTLTNGEKVLPLPIEGRIKEHPLIRENVVFGIARPLPGLLVFRAEAAKQMADDEFIDAIWPDIQAANANAEGFSQIGKDMIVPLPADVEYPQTDKGSFIRPQVYRVFAKEIDNAYSRLDHNQEGTLQLDIPGLEEHLLCMGRELIGEQLENTTTDFFTSGMDSLRAIQMRGLIIKDLDLGGNSKELNQNIVLETSNIENLAKHLYGLRQGQTPDTKDPKIAMRGLIEQYSTFQKHSPGSKPLPDKQVVPLTGATGGLGTQLVSKLSFNPSVSKIYCLLRGPKPFARLQTSLQDRKLALQTSKITALTGDLALPSLGLDQPTFSEIQSLINHIIQVAWPVNFQLPLQSFEPHIAGLHNLLQLSLSSPYTPPAKFLFCSSVSTALGAPLRTLIPETIIEDLDQALDMGYGQSKLVGEHIVAAAVETAGAEASILRIGQVVGDTKLGMWNDREAFPSIVRSELTMGVLPELGIMCEWLPVDTLADSVVELAGLDVSLEGDRGKAMKGYDGANMAAKSEENRDIDRMDTEATKGVTGEADFEGNGNTTTIQSDKTTTNDRNIDTTTENPEFQKQPKQSMKLVYNLLSPRTFSWTHDFLPALHRAGLQFSSVTTETWLQRLRSLSSQDKSNPAADPDKNPALKLLGYYESAFDGKDEEKDGRMKFEIQGAKRDSKALRGAEDVIGSGLVEKMVGWWMERWEGKGEGEKVEECTDGAMKQIEKGVKDGEGEGKAAKVNEEQKLEGEEGDNSERSKGDMDKRVLDKRYLDEDVLSSTMEGKNVQVDASQNINDVEEEAHTQSHGKKGQDVNWNSNREATAEVMAKGAKDGEGKDGTAYDEQPQDKEDGPKAAMNGEIPNRVVQSSEPVEKNEHMDASGVLNNAEGGNYENIPKKEQGRDLNGREARAVDLGVSIFILVLDRFRCAIERWRGFEMICSYC